MKTASDVNTIFAYNDSSHFFHRPVCLHMAKNIRGKYVLLDKVKANFIHTYRTYMTDCEIIIEKSVREYKQKLSSSPSKTYTPSLLAISKNVDSIIAGHLKKMSNNMDFNIKAIRIFITLMLSDYSIPELVKNDTALGDFKEKYLLKAEERAKDSLNKFVKFFKSNEFELMNIGQYETYDEWVKKIKNSKNNSIFKNKKDYEDITIAAELFAFNSEISKLAFFTTDSDFQYSTPKISKEYKQEIGNITLISNK